ncbi:MAG: AAA family ATPase [Patescibacteria group bacterium]
MTEVEWPKIGNEQAVKFLTGALQNDKVAQSYVFVGPDDLGKSTIALSFARHLQGALEGFNSDLHILQPLADQKNITIEAVRGFIKILNLSSFSNSYKIGIIKEADCLSEEAKSALLKTLEEPKDKVVIILLVSDDNNLPATILSRSQVLYFYPVAAAVIYDYLIDNQGASRSLAKDLANLSIGRPFLALRLLEHPDDYQAYLKMASLWLSLISVEVSERLAILDQIFKDRTWSKAARDLAAKIIAMAEGLARDLLLLNFAENDRVQHLAISADLEKALNYLNESSDQDPLPLILQQLKLAAQAREYLAGNINPRLVLEQLALNY